MSVEKLPEKNRTGTVVSLFVLAVLIGAAVWYFTSRPPRPSAGDTAGDSQAPPAVVQKTVTPDAVIDITALADNPETQSEMDRRKARYGIGKSLDAVVSSDEVIRVGDSEVSMARIRDELLLREGRIIEEDLQAPPGSSPSPVDHFGIYIVRQGDNIWNIHFRFLKDYFDHRGMNLAPRSDEPDSRGFSSGVGKILKFSENLVYIYNVQEKKFDVDLHLIRPLNKIIIYNMQQVFSLLEQIDAEGISAIQFDGDTLWLNSDG